VRSISKTATTFPHSLTLVEPVRPDFRLQLYLQYSTYRYVFCNVYKKDVLSQRWPCNAPCIIMGALKIFGTPWLHPRLLFPKFYGLLFRW